MGVIIELTEAKRRIKKLESEVNKLQVKLTPPEAPTVKGKILGTELLQLLSSVFPHYVDKIYLSDNEYEITAISELRKFIDWDNTNAYPYVAEIHDCDDFAEALSGSFAKHPGWSGFPVTDLWGSYGGGHAFFIAVAWSSFEDRAPSIFYVEPQNDWEIGKESVEGMELWLLAM